MDAWEGEQVEKEPPWQRENVNSFFFLHHVSFDFFLIFVYIPKLSAVIGASGLNKWRLFLIKLWKCRYNLIIQAKWQNKNNVQVIGVTYWT